MTSLNFKKNDIVEKGDIVAILKANNSHIELETEYSGQIREICVETDEKIKKCDTIMILNLDSEEYDGSIENAEMDKHFSFEDYEILSIFQQEFLPRFIYEKSTIVSLGLAIEGENIIYSLLESIYETENKQIPFTFEDFNIVITPENIAISVKIDWPEMGTPQLYERSYILISLKDIQYFTIEKIGDKLILYSIIQQGDELERIDYGPVDCDLDEEREVVLNYFLEHIRIKK